MEKGIICVDDEKLKNISGGGSKTIATVGAVLGVCGLIFITGYEVCDGILEIRKSIRS